MGAGNCGCVLHRLRAQDEQAHDDAESVLTEERSFCRDRNALFFPYSPYSAQELLVSQTRTRSSVTQSLTGYSVKVFLAFSRASWA